MSNTKARKMTPQGFLHKTTTKAANAAAGFLETHRTWLTTGELAEMTSPILRKLDDKEILPTPALEAIKNVVYGYMIASEIRKGEERIAKIEAGGDRVPKNWLATIYNKDGNICVRVKDGKEIPLQQEFDQPQEADRWCDRRLVEGETDWYGVVAHTTKTTKDGDPLATTVLRNDAMARTHASRGGPVMKNQAKSAGKLSWGVKSRPSKASFSHG
jgi:hypothetical protein